MPKNRKRDDHQYLSLDSLTPFEREVFDLALAALTLPLTTRQSWFLATAQDMKSNNAALGL